MLSSRHRRTLAYWTLGSAGAYLAQLLIIAVLGKNVWIEKDFEGAHYRLYNATWSWAYIPIFGLGNLTVLDTYIVERVDGESGVLLESRYDTLRAAYDANPFLR